MFLRLWTNRQTVPAKTLHSPLQKRKNQRYHSSLPMQVGIFHLPRLGKTASSSPHSGPRVMPPAAHPILARAGVSRRCDSPLAHLAPQPPQLAGAGGGNASNGLLGPCLTELLLRCVTSVLYFPAALYFLNRFLASCSSLDHFYFALAPSMLCCAGLNPSQQT